jgi:hypothetical protein
MINIDLATTFDIARTILQIFIAIIVVMIYFYIKHN